MAVLLTPFFLQFEDENGNPISGGFVHTYAAGTTTPKATFTDFTEDFQAANPIELDSAGRATIWISGSYKFVLTDADGAVIRTTDNVSSFTNAEDAAPAYFQAFSGTGAQTVFTTSQDLGTDEKSLFVYVDSGSGEGYNIQNPSAYTISGTTLTFAVAPASGSSNIYVFAPLTLLNAASAAAEAAETAATNSENSAIAAAASESAAAGSASAASTSASNASTSETNAGTSATNSANSALLSEDWAIKIDGLVDATDYSSKAWAIGGTGTETNNAKYYSEQALLNSGFVWRGAWSAGTYNVNESVENDGSSWIALTTTTEEPSLSAVDWDLLALKGQDGGSQTTSGTTNRITVTDGSGNPVIDIASTYAGQNTITTLGTVTTGVWNATDIAVADGGTGSSTASGARTNLGLGTAAVATLIDDDTFATATSTNIPSAESVKTYVDNNSSSGGLLNVIYYTCPSQTVTISNASPAVITYPTSGKDRPQDGCPVRFTTTGVLPTGLSTGVTYYVVNSSGTTSNVSATKGGAAIATSSAGSGTHTIANAPYLKATNNVSFVQVTVVGATSGHTTSASAAGGAGGGGAKKRILAADLSSSETVTSGVGAVADATGGTSSFGSHCSATGGTGGASPAAGGAGSGGDINVIGGKGYNASGTVTGRVAGVSAFGLSCGSALSTATAINGLPGIIIIEEYS